MFKRFSKNVVFITLLAMIMLFQATMVALAAEESKSDNKAKTPKLVLKIDREDIDQLPRNFRMGNDEFKEYPKTGIMPSRKGMDSLQNSASSTYSEKEFINVLNKLPVPANKVYVIDLRGESHGYVDGTAVSWFAANNWGNDGRTLELVKAIEHEQLNNLLKDSSVEIYNFDDKKNITLDKVMINVNSVSTEEEMVKRHGANYFRLALTDHFRPDDGDVDKFLDFYKGLPKDAWLHYHCFAGMGRTTIFMVMADILKNAHEVSFDDIVQRQGLIGIVDLSEIPDSKKNWERKAYIERYQFVKHFYDYVKASPRNLPESWSKWAKDHNYETYTPDYNGYIWRIDTPNVSKLPRNYRSSNDSFNIPQKANKQVDITYMPSREGLDKLYISGSAQSSQLEFDQLVSKLKPMAQGPIYIVDLRQESHGLLNGNGVSWFGDHDWGNINKKYDQVIADEKHRIKDALNKEVVMSELSDDKKASNPMKVKITSAITEEEMVKNAGLNYFRITATDHVWPAPENIDKFIKFVKTLPANAWLHFHCQAGEGRTTAYMVMYDMMRNPDVSLKDITYRQYFIGGQYVLNNGENSKISWKKDLYADKARNVALFYQYVQENAKSNFNMSWSEWLNVKKD